MALSDLSDLAGRVKSGVNGINVFGQRAERRPTERCPAGGDGLWDNFVNISDDIPHIVEPTTSVRLGAFQQWLVPPTQAKHATSSSIFKAKSMEGTDAPVTDLCAVCLDHFVDGDALRVYPCSHQYHDKCIEPWLAQSSHCPVCRRDAVAEPEAQEFHWC